MSRLFIFVLLIASFLSAQDEYELKDGTIIKGTVVSETANETQIETESGEIIIIKVKIDRIGGVYKIELKSGKPIIGEVTFEGEQKGENMIRLNTKEGAVELFWDNIESINEWAEARVADTLTDIDGNVYKTVQIGSQVWMASNLKVTHYNDGTEIPTGLTNGQWVFRHQGAYAEYLPPYLTDNSVEYANVGYLYNGFAVRSGKLAPEGWHVPTEEELQELYTHLGSNSGDAGSKLAGRPDIWWSDLLVRSSEFGTSGFNAVPTGYRFAELPPNFRGQETDFAGEFLGHDPKSAYFWTSTTVCEYVDELCEENMPPPRWDMETRSYIESVGGLFAYSLNFNSTGISFQSSTMQTGYSVRLIKD